MKSKETEKLWGSFWSYRCNHHSIIIWWTDHIRSILEHYHLIIWYQSISSDHLIISDVNITVLSRLLWNMCSKYLKPSSLTPICDRRWKGVFLSTHSTFNEYIHNRMHCKDLSISGEVRGWLVGRMLFALKEIWLGEPPHCACIVHIGWSLDCIAGWSVHSCIIVWSVININGPCNCNPTWCNLIKCDTVQCLNTKVSSSRCEIQGPHIGCVAVDLFGFGASMTKSSPHCANI